ncbi:hypothetical protein OIU77_017397 [Salix suchowensis]|uniref:Photosystem II protein L n=1 Tax=Salix suchowensis TaxID=1278906 RepID=A0ABQ8ZNR1_9ROSI|nr:hypothetical protein OIU77_017397 [Salix suchowensis]KAJ6316092.1 hypothetical protein OIU78_019385 [Salix suchowensis]
MQICLKQFQNSYFSLLCSHGANYYISTKVRLL